MLKYVQTIGTYLRPILMERDTVLPFKIAVDWVWYYYSALGFIPLLCISIYKYMYPLNWRHYEDKPTPKNLKQDILSMIFMYFALVYYVIDSIFTVIAWRFPDECRFYIWLHHFICIFMLPVLFSIGHFPWFITLIPCIHALLLVFPNVEILNVIYVASIVNFLYYFYCRDFKNKKYYPVVVSYTYALIFPLFGLWMYECKNIIPDYTF